MPAPQTANGRPVVEFAQSISTRDGTLTKDSKLVNGFMEASPTGVGVMKRPGYTSYVKLPSGTAQGQFSVNGLPYAIIGDVVYSVNSGTSYAIPSVTIPGLQYEFLSDTPYGQAILKTTAGMWYFNGTTVTKVADANYPSTTVSGVVYLDGYYFVMDSLGVIHGSSLNDVTTWPVLSVIQVDASLGKGVAIHRHLNYVAALLTHGTQMFYDAGTTAGASGSPLSPVGNASFRTGCRNGSSVVELQDIMIFIGNSTADGRSIMSMENFSLSRISSPYVERVLATSNLNSVYAFAIEIAGHQFYVLSLFDIGVSLVYDQTVKDWVVWTSTLSNGTQVAFQPTGYLESGGKHLIQDPSSGYVYQMDMSYYTDNGLPITLFIRTEQYNWGSMDMKFIAAISLLADTVNTTLLVRYSDDDYQTFSAWRSIDMSTVRKMLQRLGSTRRRSFDFQHTDNTLLKLYYADMEFRQGIKQ